MTTITSLPVTGYKNRPVPNTFFKQDNGSSHLAIIYPGYGYTADMPALYYPGQLLQDHGADLLKVNYDYSATDEFANAFDEEQYVWLYTDAFAAWEEAWKQRVYQQVTLIGKSLGSLAVAHIVANDSRLSRVSCVFVTPALSDHSFTNDILDARPRSLLVIGTDDRYYQPETLKDLEQATHSEALVFQRANHSLEIKNNLAGSIRIMERMIQAMDIFIREARLG